jgi:uncharacterized membrane protein
MISGKSKLMLRTAGLSALAGMRTMSAPALLTGSRRFIERNNAASEILDSRYVTLTVQALAVGEMVADKLPFMPKRTWFPALLARTVSGAVMGASVFNSEDESMLSGAVIGGASAIMATYVSYNVRRVLTKTFHVPDFIVAIAEDSFILGCGRKLLEDQFGKDETIAAQV